MDQSTTSRGHAHNFQDLTGQRFGLWIVQGLSPRSCKATFWRCFCECGSVHDISAPCLKTGESKSCGCDKPPVVRKHGASRTNEYNIYIGMLARCLQEDHESYHYYGARGITVCDRWQGPLGYFCFMADMGFRPSNKHSIDRINGSGPYSPDNCRWATPTEQGRNKPRVMVLTCHGETLSIGEWVERTGLPKNTIKGRLERGWTVEDALSKPPAVVIGFRNARQNRQE